MLIRLMSVTRFWLLYEKKFVVKSLAKIYDSFLFLFASSIHNPSSFFLTFDFGFEKI